MSVLIIKQIDDWSYALARLLEVRGVPTQHVLEAHDTREVTHANT